MRKFNVHRLELLTNLLIGVSAEATDFKESTEFFEA